MYVWRSDHILGQSLFSLYPVGLKDHTQIIILVATPIATEPSWLPTKG